MTNQVFTFGENWQEYIEKHVNDTRIQEAIKSLIEFLRIKNLRSKTFLDIGCGSGLFSLAAHRLRAKKITSFDYDRNSVRCTEYLYKKEGSPGNWFVSEGSILDKKFVSSLGKFDYVYAWGVLHHTGKMWQALANTCELVKRDGFLYIAIYNKVEEFCVYRDGRIGTSSFWNKIKKQYAFTPRFVQNSINYLLMSILIMSYIITLQNPFKKMQEHINLRGMSWSIDMKDWLGGYPYEYATVEEIFNYVRQKGFTLINLRCGSGLRNNEYVFKKNQL